MTDQALSSTSQAAANSTHTPASPGNLSSSTLIEHTETTASNSFQPSMSPQHSRPQCLHKRSPSEHFEDRVEALRHDAPEERWNIRMPEGSGEASIKGSQSGHDNLNTSPTPHPYTYLQPAPSPPRRRNSSVVLRISVVRLRRLSSLARHKGSKEMTQRVTAAAAM